jgi:hypothetical protein
VVVVVALGLSNPSSDALEKSLAMPGTLGRGLLFLSPVPPGKYFILKLLS